MAHRSDAPELHPPSDLPQVSQEQAGLEYDHTRYANQYQTYDNNTNYMLFPTGAPAAPHEHPLTQPGQVVSPSSMENPSSPLSAAGESAQKEAAQRSAADQHQKKVVLLLSVIIGILFAAVIALSAGTGVMVKRANNAEAELANTTADGSSAPSPSDLINEPTGLCVSNTSANGDTYVPLFWDFPTFRIHCNMDTDTDMIMSIFVGSLDECLDACAAWTSKVPGIFGAEVAESNKNLTCSSASFVPAFTDRATAQAAADGSGSWGNCYLKPEADNDSQLHPVVGDIANHIGIMER